VTRLLARACQELHDAEVDARQGPQLDRLKVAADAGGVVADEGSSMGARLGEVAAQPCGEQADRFCRELEPGSALGGHGLAPGMRTLDEGACRQLVPEIEQRRRQRQGQLGVVLDTLAWQAVQHAAQRRELSAHHQRHPVLARECSDGVPVGRLRAVAQRVRRPAGIHVPAGRAPMQRREVTG
jgi:hypothetical protein